MFFKILIGARGKLLYPRTTTFNQLDRGKNGCFSTIVAFLSWVAVIGYIGRYYCLNLIFVNPPSQTVLFPAPSLSAVHHMLSGISEQYLSNSALSIKVAVQYNLTSATVAHPQPHTPLTATCPIVFVRSTLHSRLKLQPRG